MSTCLPHLHALHLPGPARSTAGGEHQPGFLIRCARVDTVAQDAPYDVKCWKCSELFDALEAEWCACLNQERTLVCPHCKSCFCNASFGYKKQFWAGAPQTQWDRKSSEHQKADAFENPAPEAVRRPLVLLVDDEPVTRAIAIRVIEKLGYGLIVACDGEEGLALAGIYRPELVLTDAMMPKLDGREMGRRIKGDAATASTFIVVMTSLYKDSRYKSEALGHFASDEYLTKPLAADRLQSVLQRFLG